MGKDHMVGFGMGLLTGAIIGGVIALLYAPMSGKETRQMIKEKASDVAEGAKEKASNIMGEVKNKATGVMHAIKE